MAQRVKIIDRGWKEIKAQLKILDEHVVKVGFLKSAGNEDDGTSIVLVAAVNQFGRDSKPVIPKRPFIDTGIKDKLSEIKALNKKSIIAIENRKMKSERAFQLLGLKGKVAIQEKITTLNSPANSDVTIERKGSSNPLIHSGQMREAVDYEVI